MNHVPQHFGGVAIHLTGGVIARVGGDADRGPSIGDRVAEALRAGPGVDYGDVGGRSPLYATPWIVAGAFDPKSKAWV